MGKQKKKETNKFNNNKNKDKNKDRISQQPLAPPSKPLQFKRKVADLTSFLKKEESISPPTIQQRFSLQYFLKCTSIQCLILQCPNLRNAVEAIKKKISIEKDLLYGLLQNFLKGNKQSIWSDKYKPKNLKECLHSQVGQKIKIWLKSFYYYRNNSFEESNSFIDDYFNQNSNAELKSIRQFNWKLKGLILKGREGVGKATTIMATAKQMQYQIYPCGNQCNQIKYLKQKNQATQSQCVKTKMNKNMFNIQKTNKSIASFAIKNQQSEVQSLVKKIQFMHNVNLVYPEDQKIKFYTQLKKTTQSSKIPFLMTSTGQEVCQHLSIYDIIQFSQANIQQIATLLYLVYHIQNSFSQKINFQRIVQKEKFKEILNDQFKNFTFDIVSPLNDFIKLTQIFNKKLDILFTYIQQSKKFFGFLNLDNAEQIMKQYLKRANNLRLMQDFFYSQNKNLFEDDSKQLSFQIIDTSKYLIPQEKQKVKQQIKDDEKLKDSLQNDVPTSVFTPIKEDQKANDQNILINNENNDYIKNSQMDQQKCEGNSNQERRNDQQEGGNENEYSGVKGNLKKQRQKKSEMSEIVNKLKMKVIQDYGAKIEGDEHFMFSKLYNPSREQLQENLLWNISMYIIHKYRKNHQDIRKDILTNVKKEYYMQNELLTSLKKKELNYIGFLIGSQGRISRKSSNRECLNLKKLLKNNEINYLKTFTQFLKPNSFLNK